MALYLEACLEEAGDDAAFIVKALGTIGCAKGMTQLAKETGLGRGAYTKHCPVKAIQALRQS